jgi:large subunit GTPase 1
MMPGKTKHYQTLFLPEDKEMCLMDCPGLVFPSFSSSKADMLVNGILPIDTLREYHPAISIIIKKIPRKILEKFYKIELPDIYSATQFLQVLATNRGFITGRALPDEARTAKIVLKDYVSGKLLYCNLRPDYSEEKFGHIINYQNISDLKIDEKEKENMQIIKEIPADFDDNYEKIDIQIDNKKVLENDTNFDKMYFEDEFIKTIPKEMKITKDIYRALKYAMKRGDVIYLILFYLINLDNPR